MRGCHRALWGMWLVGCGGATVASPVGNPAAVESDHRHVAVRGSGMSFSVPEAYGYETMFEFSASGSDRKVTISFAGDAGDDVAVFAELRETMRLELGRRPGAGTASEISERKALRYDVAQPAGHLRMAAAALAGDRRVQVLEQTAPADDSDFNMVCGSLVESPVDRPTPPGFHDYQLGGFQVCVPRLLQLGLMVFADREGETLLIREHRSGGIAGLDEVMKSTSEQDGRELSAVQQRSWRTGDQQVREVAYRVHAPDADRLWAERRAQVDLDDGRRVMIHAIASGDPAAESRFHTRWSKILDSLRVETPPS